MAGEIQKILRLAATVVATLSIASACSDALVQDLPAGNVLAAYVVLGPSPSDELRAYARVIVPKGTSSCPEVVPERSDAISMRVRDNPHGFPVRVCEAVIPFQVPATLSWTGQALPTPKRDPERLVLFGDTGCKEKDCATPSLAKPFDELAPEAAALAPTPDVILHVGDYNYRGTPSEVNGSSDLSVYDAGDDSSSPTCQLDAPYVSQNAGYSEGPDTWENWRIEFFDPAAELLATAPLVLARGNHELCSRAGPGWFYFLDASSNLEGGTQLRCPPQGGAEPPTDDVLSHLQLTEPRYVDLGTLRIVVIDSANACDDYAPTATTDIYTRQLREVAERAAGDVPTWVLTHRPFWGVESLCGSGDSGCRPDVINHTLQAALAAVDADGGLPPNVTLFVSGHMHLFQSIGFAPRAGPDRPPQLVVGNGGVEASSGPGDGPFSIDLDATLVQGLTSTKHGFTHIPRLAPDGSWDGEVVNPHKGETIARCAQPLVDGFLCRPPL